MTVHAGRGIENYCHGGPLDGLCWGPVLGGTTRATPGVSWGAKFQLDLRGVAPGLLRSPRPVHGTWSPKLHRALKGPTGTGIVNIKIIPKTWNVLSGADVNIR